MGLFNFFRGGKKVAAAETPTKTELEKEISDLGLDASGVDIDVQEGKVSVSGKAVDQETREKLILAMGNVDGITEVEDKTAGEEPTFYTVEKGDSLWKIASATLGNGADYMKIFEANKPMLSDPEKIYPGQVLRIPS